MKFTSQKNEAQKICNYIFYIGTGNRINMSLYFFLRHVLVCIMLVGWIFYQLLIKKRPWSVLKGDAMAATFFVAVWVALAYFLTH